MVVTLDRREKALSAALVIEHVLMELPVGDILLSQEGCEMIIERKAAQDLAQEAAAGGPAAPDRPQLKNMD